MAWVDNLVEAAYSSPSGERVVFDYEDVSVSIDKKTSAHNFPDADGTHIQDKGNTGRQYPLRCYLWGADYDERAVAFEAALLERGMGKLEHPIYGTVNVVPYGSITRRDDLKTAANQTVFEVTFWETIDLLYPSAQEDPASEVAEAVGEFNATVDLQGIDSAVGLAAFQAEMQKYIDIVKDPLGSLADASKEVGEQFKEIVESIERNLVDPAFMEAIALAGRAEEQFKSVLAEVEEGIIAPATLTIKTFKMLQAAARSPAEGRQDVYEELMDAIVGDVTPADGITLPTRPDIQLPATIYIPRELYAMGFLTGSIITLINTQYSTKVQAIGAAERLLTQFNKLVTWRDNNYIGVDTGVRYQKLQEAVALTAGYLVEISFTLKQERRVVLDRERTIIDLAAEFYGSVDDKLDFLINSNDLTGDEILELPRGREIVYYI